MTLGEALKKSVESFDIEAFNSITSMLRFKYKLTYQQMLIYCGKFTEIDTDAFEYQMSEAGQFN